MNKDEVMAFTNFDTKEINCKIVYFGPSGSGKSSNLQSVLANSTPEIKTGLFEIDKASSNHFFEFLPISLGHVKDFHLKLHIFTIPASRVYKSVVSTIIRGLDGWVFVADARVEKLPENIHAFAKAKELMASAGYLPSMLPYVIQYNKVDLKNLAPIEVMRRELNPAGHDDYEAVAAESIGTMETLQGITKKVLDQICDVS
tara:strand:+ start:406 stop:1008 length:603 start_codon:yes stop_codon:yes gene_type:complete